MILFWRHIPGVFSRMCCVSGVVSRRRHLYDLSIQPRVAKNCGYFGTETNQLFSNPFLLMPTLVNRICCNSLRMLWKKLLTIIFMNNLNIEHYFQCYFLLLCRKLCHGFIHPWFFSTLILPWERVTTSVNGYSLVSLSGPNWHACWVAVDIFNCRKRSRWMGQWPVVRMPYISL